MRHQTILLLLAVAAINAATSIPRRTNLPDLMGELSGKALSYLKPKAVELLTCLKAKGIASVKKMLNGNIVGKLMKDIFGRRRLDWKKHLAGAVLKLACSIGSGPAVKICQDKVIPAVVNGLASKLSSAAKKLPHGVGTSILGVLKTCFIKVGKTTCADIVKGVCGHGKPPATPPIPAAPKPAPKPAVKPAPKPVVKPAPKPVVKPAPKPVVKPAPKPTCSKVGKPVGCAAGYSKKTHHQKLLCYKNCPAGWNWYLDPGYNGSLPTCQKGADAQPQTSGGVPPKCASGERQAGGLCYKKC